MVEVAGVVAIWASRFSPSLGRGGRIRGTIWGKERNVVGLVVMEWSGFGGFPGWRGAEGGGWKLVWGEPDALMERSGIGGGMGVLRCSGGGRTGFHDGRSAGGYWVILWWAVRAWRAGRGAEPGEG